MTNCSPDEFYAAFLKVADEHKAPRTGGSIEERTNGFRKVVPAIAKELNMTHGHEYCFKLDAHFYHKLVTCFRPADKWMKYISIALEHENNPDYSPEEVIKPQRVNAPLSVLVTYPQTKENGEALLQTFATIIQDADVFGNASTQRRQMCIFGYSRDPGAGGQGFVYQDGRFVEQIKDMEYLRERDRRATQEKFRKALLQVADVEAEAYDRFRVKLLSQFADGTLSA